MDSLAGDVAAVSLTAADVEAVHQTYLERLVERLAEEPLSILAENPIVGPTDLENMSYKKAYDLRRDYRHAALPGPHKGFNVCALSTLDLAAADVLVRLYELHGVEKMWLPAIWGEMKDRLEIALRVFIAERDALLSRHGEKFREGPHRDRWDTLARLMSAAYHDLTKRHSRQPTVREVWRHLPKVDPQRLVIAEEPTDDDLTYVKKGELEDIDFRAFEKRYTRLLAKLRRKSYPR